MSDEEATITYMVREPFEQAVRSLRKALSDGNLELAGELDISSRIRQKLLVDTAPCRVFFVTAAPGVFEKPGADPYAAALTPLHVVISARGSQTEVHLLRPFSAQKQPMAPPTLAAFRRLQIRVVEAVERIGMRCRFGA